MRHVSSFASLLAVSLFGLVGCGHALSYTATNAPPRRLSPRAPATVEVFVMDRPARPHVEVGLFEIAQRSSASGSTPEMIEKLRVRAGQVGCDAIWVSAATERVQSYTAHTHQTVHVTSANAHHGYGNVHATTYAHPNVVRSHFASCIAYTDAAPPGAAATTGDVSL